jgi:hypothetical protein
MQIAGLSPASTSAAASRFCASLPYFIIAPSAPMFDSTHIRPTVLHALAISSMSTTASR